MPTGDWTLRPQNVDQIRFDRDVRGVRRYGGTVATIDPNSMWVLSVDAVRWSIETLGAQKLHPALPMYLYLRKKAGEGQLESASAASSELLALIAMEGNPEKPYYFPIIDRGRRDLGPLPTFWRAPNISGSWSAGSIRRQPAASWLADDSGNYVMPEDNAQLALDRLLYGTRVSSVALGAFFLRNDVIAIHDGSPAGIDVADAFRLKFGFNEGDPDFDLLFSTQATSPTPFHWFDRAPEHVLEKLSD